MPMYVIIALIVIVVVTAITLLVVSCIVYLCHRCKTGRAPHSRKFFTVIETDNYSIIWVAC